MKGYGDCAAELYKLEWLDMENPASTRNMLHYVIGTTEAIVSFLSLLKLFEGIRVFGVNIIEMETGKRVIFNEESGLSFKWAEPQIDYLDRD